MKAIHLLLLVAVLGLGWLAWTRLPGLRTRVTGAVDDHAGWTEDARQADPVGFLTHAQEKLSKDIEAFRASRESLVETKANAEAEKQKNEALLAVADELARTFRQGYRVAAAAGQWPVEIEGAAYDREELVEQVESILSERDSYARVVGIYAEVIEKADALRDELRGRIQSTEATLVELEAQRELVRVDKLTAEADELLAQVDALLSGNRAALVEIDDPVRSVEALLAASRESEGRRPAGTSALEFLNAE